MRSLLALLLLASSVGAHAQTLPTCAAPIPDPVPRDAVRLNWTPPTQNTDHTPITATIGFIVYENAKLPANAKCSSGASSVSLTGLSVGAHSWVVTALVSGDESDASNAAAKTIAPGKPMPPTNLTADPGNLVAFGVQQSNGATALADGKIVPYAVAEIRVNTACDPATSFDGMYQVPKSAVTLWYGDVRPAVLFAQCLPGSGG